MRNPMIQSAEIEDADPVRVVGYRSWVWWASTAVNWVLAIWKNSCYDTRQTLREQWPTGRCSGVVDLESAVGATPLRFRHPTSFAEERFANGHRISYGIATPPRDDSLR